MPLLRFPVRNEYGLGHPELYREAEKDDPKGLLQGVAVAGLVGILRQLGDLAEFAAEVFHGLQEEVTNTSSRSRKVMVRVQRIEAALPSLEKSMVSQKSHLHFAYTSGSVWRPRLQIEKNLILNSNLPQFIMDSYEECSDPPRLHALDKFDSGGPGSCLKRYSDPTFFKKASALSSEMLNDDKHSKIRKANRRKKKRARQRTVSSRDPTISNHTDRPQFSSLQAGVQISLSPSQQTFSTTKSDQEEQPNTYDLRTDSSYIECVFHSTDPIKPEEHEPEQVSISSSQNLPDNSTFDLASIDECNRDVDEDHYRQSPLQEQIRASSSSVSWEEKAEIVESIVHQHEHVEAAEVLETDFRGDDEEKGEVISDNVGEIEFSVDNEGLFTFMSSQIQPDDLDSEPDTFMDALNNIESESETDTDFQTKHEVDGSFNLNNDRALDEVNNQMLHHAEDTMSNGIKQEVNQSCNIDNYITKEGICEFVVDSSDIQPTNLESSSTAYNGPYVDPSFDNVFSPQFHVPEELPISAQQSCKVDSSTGNSSVENVITESLSNLLDAEVVPRQNLILNEDQNPFGGCQTNPKESSSFQPVQFWTNGGLLGLQPSKPPVFVAPNTVDEDPVANDKVVGKSSLAQSNAGKVGKPDELTQSSEIVERNSSKCSTSYRDDSNAVSDKKTSWRFLSAVLDTKREKNSYFQLSNSFNNNLVHSLGRVNGVIPINEQKVPVDGRALCNAATQGDMSNGSQISVLSNRIPLNDFQRSLVHNKGLGQCAVYDRTFNGYNGGGSIMHSPSSPPLQHMKISFQPAYDAATPKLKLKFPDGSFGHESSSYMLPSFQLVPEPASSHCDNGSDSDDDTFCRSSPYMSDDRLETESDSEQWDSDDNLQNGICNMSINESFSTSMETEESRRHGSTDVDYGFQSFNVEKCSESNQVNTAPDIPSLSSMNPLFEQDMKILSNDKNIQNLHLPEEHTPQPPPLPPSEWRNINANSNITISMQERDSGKQPVLCSTVPPRSRMNSVKQHQETKEAVAPSPRGEAVALSPRRELERRKSTGQKEENQIPKGFVVDEKDFLNQIRAKSCNLRRTGTITEKPNVTPGLVTNARVTAILEKANAIRQAVGSDDGEDDDSWSEA